MIGGLFSILNIFVSNTQEDLPISEEKVRSVTRAVIDHMHQSCCETSIYFVTDEEICELHEQYFNDPSSTDCISFPMDDETTPADERILGDVFVCPKTAINYASSHNCNVYDELTLYLVHGLLHLMGWDDIEEDDIKEMRLAEKQCMEHLKMLDLGLGS
ncbi:MAG: rRNA maturation RNase YbeY [Chlamydiota bacterium]|nr:rRNA maturation RNase YbeY [Chlamydiota bacterium]